MTDLPVPLNLHEYEAAAVSGLDDVRRVRELHRGEFDLAVGLAGCRAIAERSSNFVA